jgi:hypothetical protein
LSLFNQGGGRLIFGFDDKTRQPVDTGRPPNVSAAYHGDKLQQIVGDYVARPFEAKVLIGQRDGQDFPVVVVPSGVKTPVPARKNFPSDARGKLVVRQNAIYIRSIQDNRVATTEPLTPDDWDQLMQRCFDNREMDIGRFFRRNLPGIVDELRKHGALAADSQLDLGPKPEIKAEVKQAVKKLDEGTMRFQDRLNYLDREGKKPSIAKEVGWREVAVAVKGTISRFPAQNFLGHLFAHQPRLSGWPIWIDSRGFSEQDQHPYPNGPAWEALVRNNVIPGRFTSDLIDFWHIDPVCWFYHRRIYYEDILPGFLDQNGRGLDFSRSISMVTETIAVATAFAGALSADPGRTHLEFAFRWNQLQGRKLGAYFEPGRDFFSPKVAYKDEAMSVVEVELSNQRTTLARYVAMAVSPLFEVFGYTAPQSLIDEIVDRTINRN